MKNNNFGRIIAYADDIIIIASNLKELKDALSQVKLYLTGHQLKLNSKKSEVICFNASKKPKKV